MAAQRNQLQTRWLALKKNTVELESVVFAREFTGFFRWVWLNKMAEILLNPHDYVHHVFKQEEDPMDAIANIQKDNRIRVPSLQPALCLLDLHDFTRSEIHQSLFSTLKEMLVSKLPVLEPRAMKRLLDKSFNYASVPELRAVVMNILETMPKPINEKLACHGGRGREVLYLNCLF